MIVTSSLLYKHEQATTLIKCKKKVVATKVIYIGDYQPGKSICSGLYELGNTLKPKKSGIGNFWQKNNWLFGHYLNFFESCIQPTMYVINCTFHVTYAF